MIILFVLLSQFTVANSDSPLKTLQSKVEQLSCESLLVWDKPPTDPGLAPNQPSALRTAGRMMLGPISAVRQHLQEKQTAEKYRKDLHTFSDYQRRLNERKQDLRSRWNVFFSQGGLLIDSAPMVEAVYNVLAEKYRSLMESANSLERVEKGHEELSDLAQDLFIYSNGLKAIKRATRDELNALEKRGKKTAIANDISAIVEALRISLKEIGSIEDVNSAWKSSFDQATALIEEHDLAVQVRRAHELRVDLAQEQSSNKILDALAKLAPKVDWSVRKELFQIMETDPEVQAYMNTELQTTRRLGKANAESTLIELRLTNTLSLVRGRSVAMLKQLRQNILQLNHPQTLAGLIPAEDFRPLNLFERETVLKDALNNEALKLTILNAGLELLPTLAPPSPPREPSRTPPTQPTVPSKARSSSHARQIKSEIEAFKRKVDQWKQAWDQYKAAVETYKKIDLPKHLERATHLRASHTRRLQARQAYVTYLTLVQAQVFSPSVAEKLADERKAWAKMQLDKIEDARQRAKVLEEARSTTSTHDDMMYFWYWYFLVLNPSWTNDPATVQNAYLFDSSQFSPSSGDQGLQINLPHDALVDAPQFTIPDFNLDVPDVQIPDIQIPDIQIPDIQIPDVQIPNLQIQDVSPSNFSSSDSGSSFSTGGE